MSDPIVRWGWSQPDTDTLTVLGDIAPVWTPDGMGGGVLSLDVPAGPGCGGGDEIDYGLRLELSRAGCGRKFRVSVDAVGGYPPTPELSAGIVGHGSALLMQSAGTTPCETSDVEVLEGANPIDVTMGCGDSLLYVTLSGTTASNTALSFSITITAL